MEPVTEEERSAVALKVENAIENVNIDASNVKLYMKISTRRKDLAWMPLMC